MSKIRDFLNENKLDAILISDEYNMHYLSGAIYEGLFVGTKNKNYIITDSRYTEVAQRDKYDAEVVEMTKNFFEILKDIFSISEVKNVGFEDLHLTYNAYSVYKNLGVKLIPLGSKINDLRHIKTEDELEKLAIAESIGDKAFDHILGVIKPGMTEMDIAIEIEMAMKRNGADNLSFDTIVASGINGSMPHAVPGQKKVQLGELITMDFGCKYKGYCSDMTRTIMLGKANDKQKEIYSIVLEAQLAALDFIKAGVKGKEVDKVARDIITKYGYGENFGHGLGHSVGLFIHESPTVSPREERILQENIIETIEPGIYVPGFGGVRIEDMVVVKKNGCDNLAHSPKHLIEL